MPRTIAIAFAFALAVMGQARADQEVLAHNPWEREVSVGLALDLDAFELGLSFNLSPVKRVIDRIGGS